MNSIAILPRTMMNVLQNMNIKRDTLEKRAYIPDHFKPKNASPATSGGVSPATNTGTGTGTGTATGRDNNDLSPSLQHINSQQYDNQYLPSSLRSNHNPFSITAAITAPVIIPDGDKQVISSVLGTPLAESATAAGTTAADIGGGSGVLPSTDYNLVQKEVTVL